MSLQVWLPLNGNLTNLGLDGTKVPSLMGSGITYTAGKIGKAATFPNNCNSCIYMNGLKLQIFSWAIWFKVLGEGSGTSQRFMSEGRDTGSVGTNLWVSKDGTTLSWSTHKKSGNITISLNTWYHVILTADGSNIKLYLNGELKSTTSYTENSDYAQSNDKLVLGKMSYSYTNSSNYFPFNGQLNDVRIYDHALSAKEVEEISKGLVLHYKLDNNGLGNKNIAKPSIGTATTSSAELNTTTFTGWDNYATYDLALTATEWANMVGKTITYSIWMENISQTVGTGTGIMLHFRYADGTYQQFGGGKNGTNGSYLTQGESGWLKLTVTVPDPSIRSNPTTINRVQYSIRHNSSNGASTVNYQYAKVELGSIQTPWSPYTEETMIYDVSGYSHHAVPVGTIAVTSPSPRYSVATHLINGSYVRLEERPAVALPTDAITVNLWMNCSTWGNPISCTEGGGFNFENSSGLRFITYVSGIGYKYAQTSIAPSTLLNNWHMLTGTFDKTTISIYIDGELKTATATGSTAGIGYANNYLFLGAEAAGNATTPANSTFVGDISDVRIYATALSDAAIKELYNTSMAIDSNGNIMAREIQE